MELVCLNQFVKDIPCCGKQRGYTLFHGVKIIDEQRTYYHEFPVNVRIQKGKLIFTSDGVEKHYKLNLFTQTESEIMTIIQRCVSSLSGNELILKKQTYVVDDGPQSTFLCPKEDTETYLSSDNYLVFVNGLLRSEGTDELEWVLDGGDVFFTVAIPDDTPSEDPSVVEIFYFVKY